MAEFALQRLFLLYDLTVVCTSSTCWTFCCSHWSRKLDKDGELNWNYTDKHPSVHQIHPIA